MTGAEVHRTRSSDGTVIGWERTGAGPPLVLVHGSFSDRTCWSQSVPLLAPHFELASVDRRGRGLSPAPGPTDLAREAADLRAVLDALGRPAAICGWSFGAVVALQAVLEGVPCTRLVLYEPPLPVASALPEGFRSEFFGLVEAGEHEAATVLFLIRVMRLQPAVVAVMQQYPLWPNVVAAAPSARWEMVVLDAYHYDVDLVRACRVPATVLAGTNSPPHLVEAGELLAGDLPAARLVRLPGQHHFAHLSNPAEFTAAVRQALSPVSPARAVRGVEGGTR
ncbi:MAG TPA: alpha/beta hydrolase [Candidatus Eisenbacteria bacterium]|nr:alpha/beta hydrolase [Candidatus Eisenbacteria bacterium]